MKTRRLLTLVFAAAFASVAQAQRIPLKEILGPDNTFKDPVYGVSLSYPSGWEVRDAQRWGKDNKENTLFLAAVWPSESRPSVYWAPLNEKPEPGKEEAYFRMVAERKAASRVASGMSDYANVAGSFEFFQIGGRPAMRYLARYTIRGKPVAEFFTRVLGEQTMVMLFVQMPPDELASLRPELDRMMATVRLP